MVRNETSFTKAVSFHGHACPGLAVGYRVAICAMRELLSGRAVDEELVAIVENNSCAVDAIQALCGCTFGKGNLVFEDHGKHSYTFFNRASGSGLRIYADMLHFDDPDNKRFVELAGKASRSDKENMELDEIRQRRVETILSMPEKKLISISAAKHEIPSRAMIFNSPQCDRCNERIMETRLMDYHNKKVCIPCFNELQGDASLK